VAHSATTPQTFGLSDPAMEEALRDVPLYRYTEDSRSSTVR